MPCRHSAKGQLRQAAEGAGRHAASALQLRGSCTEAAYQQRSLSSVQQQLYAWPALRVAMTMLKAEGGVHKLGEQAMGCTNTPTPKHRRCTLPQAQATIHPHTQKHTLPHTDTNVHIHTHARTQTHKHTHTEASHEHSNLSWLVQQITL